MKILEDREKNIIRVSIIGITANVFLAGFKFLVGMFSHSIAIMIDSLNNASDVLSSVITVIGTKLANRPADKAHPYGHGRSEYISAAIISAIIIYAGITALIEAARKIFNPVTPEYSPETLIVVSAGIIVKIILGRYVSSQGKKLASDSLVNSGKDALMDSAVSSSTLLGAFVFILFGINLESWLGAFISILIIKAGVDMFRETTSKILGERAESGFTNAVKKTICMTEGIFGAYDLILTNYGPDMLMGSVHVEVPEDWNAEKIDTVSREIMHRVFIEHHIMLAAVGIYSHNSSDDEVIKIRSEVTRVVMSQDYVLQIHGFYCSTQEKIIRFDIVIDFSAPDSHEVYRNVLEKIQALYPDYSITVQPDSDYSD